MTPSSDLELGPLTSQNQNHTYVLDSSSSQEPTGAEFRGKRSSGAKDEISSKIAAQPSFGYVCELKIGPNRGCDICGIKELPFRARHCRDCNRCVRKFDHHCFWIGGCVGELNHYKFYLFLFLQTWAFIWNIGTCLYGYSLRLDEWPDDSKMAGHVGSVWMFWLFFLVLFMMLTGGLCLYHSFLITTAQTTWEHTRRDQISYLKPYPRSLLPFYISIRTNVWNTFKHGNKHTNWKLRQPAELK